jgi:hypothetical protein
MTKYRVQKITTGLEEIFVTVEASSIAKAIKASGWAKSKIAEVRTLKSALPFTTIAASGGFEFISPEGLKVTSSDLEVFNVALETLGYGAVHETFNLLNRGAGSFLIEADTPWSCNPASESYHSM